MMPQFLLGQGAVKMRVVRLFSVFLMGLAVARLAGAAERDVRVAEAIRRSDLGAVTALLKAGADVNGAEPDGRTALHWAAYRNSLEAVTLLLKSGARVNATTDLGITPLWVACDNSNTAIVARLLEARADPNIVPETDGTPLMRASRTGNTEAVKLLLDKRADVNAKETARGQTALMWAVAEQHPDVVKLLLAKGADVRARSVTSRRYVLMCCQEFEGDPGGGDYVIEGGDTPLLFAARVGDVESARLLLDAGASIEEAAPTGAAPLAMAAHSDQGALAAFLLDRGANPNADGAGYTALHGAVLRSNLPLLKTLLAHGANLNARQTQASPAKRYSGFGFDKRMIGATPFLLATRASQLDAMRALAAGGADVNLGLENGTTPIMSAAMRQIRGGRFAEARVVEAVKLAMELGSHVNTANNDGDTALHFAATRRLDSVVQFLADNGAAINAKNKMRQTPLAAVLVPVPPAKGAGQATFDEYNFLASHTDGTAALLRKLGGTE
jgi:ankyrin repeat protein